MAGVIMTIEGNSNGMKKWNPHKMRVVQIEKIINENKMTKSFYFTENCTSQAQPGQFVMLWVPHVSSHAVDFRIPDQIPMGVSSVHRETFSLTVRKCGDTTGELFRYNAKDIVGITGPLGRGFTLSGESILCVGGGIGCAPLRFLVQTLQEPPVYFVLGAKKKNELLFEKELRDLCSEVYITTDDGSYGVKGFASDLVEELCTAHDIDQIFCCGPELMMHKVLRIALDLGISAQFSLERYMYCGLGICGHCTIDSHLVCKDGPVFTSKELSTMKDFGRLKVDETGNRIPLCEG